MAEEKMKIVVANVDIGQTELSLKRTRWTGNLKTKDSHFEKLLNQPNLPKSSEINDVGKLLQYKMQLRQALMGSGLFKDVTIHSQAYAENKDHAANGNDVELLINVVESSRTTGQIGTEVDPNNVGKIEGKFELNFNNIFGSGETLQLKTNNDPLSQLHKINSTPVKLLMPDTYNMTLSKPIISTKTKQYPISNITCNIEDKTNNLPWLEARERGRSSGINLGLTSYLDGKYKHSLGFELAWRHLVGNRGANVPLSVRECFGHTQKCSFKYNGALSDLTFSEKNTIPSAGYKLSGEVEAAGLSGTSEFNKISFNAQQYTSFGTLTGCMNFRAGIIQGTPDIQDKLYLGGPMDIRGYDQNTAGPKSGGTRLVGAGAHLYYPLSKQGINLHGFVTGGAATNDNSLVSVQKNFKYSFGVGLCTGLGQAMQGANLQINYIHKPKSKFEMGIGFDIL